MSLNDNIRVARVIFAMNTVSDENKDFIDNFRQKATELLKLLTGIQGIQRSIAVKMWKHVLPLFTTALGLDSVTHVDNSQQTDSTWPTNLYAPRPCCESRKLPVQTAEAKIDKSTSALFGDDHSYIVTSPKVTTQTEQVNSLTEKFVHVQLEREDGSTSLIQVKSDDVSKDVFKTVPNKFEVLMQHDDGRDEVCSLSKESLELNGPSLPPVFARPTLSAWSDSSMLVIPDYPVSDNDHDDNGEEMDEDFPLTNVGHQKSSTVNNEVYTTDGEKLPRGKGRPKKLDPYPSVVDENGRRVYSCPLCSAQLMSIYSLEVHLRVHSGHKPFSCSVCGKTFTTKGNMNQHARSHSDTKPFQCRECNKFFKDEKVLRVHMRIHSGARPYKCDICLKTFTQSGTLASHRNTHAGIKKYLCDLCGKHFTCSGQLKTHRLRHLNQRDFKCGQCELSFVCKGELDRHLLHHSGSKPFLCSLCPKGFSRKSYLNEHMNFHSGETPYQCSACTLSFHDYAKFNRHRHKHRLEEEKKRKQEDSERESSLQAQLDSESIDDMSATSLQVVVDENTGPEELEKLHSIVLSVVNSGQISVNSRLPSQSVYQVTLTDNDSGKHMDLSAMNILANATAEQLEKND